MHGGDYSLLEAHCELLATITIQYVHGHNSSAGLSSGFHAHRCRLRTSLPDDGAPALVTFRREFTKPCLTELLEELVRELNVWKWYCD